MICETNFYSEKLKETLKERQRINSSYSLRAFSRDIGMSPSTLTLVMQKKRPLPKKYVENVISYLDMNPSEEAIFRESLNGKKGKLNKIEISEELKNRYILDDSHFKVIAEYEHYAILSLLETKGFISDVNFISKRLGISNERTKQVLNSLEIANLIENCADGNIKLTCGPVRTTEDISSKALKLSHKELLEMGKSKIDEIDLELRDFSSMTLAIDPNKIPEAKEVIREFRQKLATLLKDGDKSEVYQVGIQLYPLTTNLQ